MHVAHGLACRRGKEISKNGKIKSGMETTVAGGELVMDAIDLRMVSD